MTSTVSLRAIEAGDEDFLCQVYGSTRAQEMALVDWDDKQKAAFLRQQFEAQHRHYQQHYADGSFQVIVVDAQPVGRLYLARWPGDTRIVDIAVLPEFRGRGVGSRLLTDILAGAAARRDSVTIHVERNNPALGWYQRLGFGLAQDRGVYLFLRWEPPDAGGGRDAAATPLPA